MGRDVDLVGGWECFIEILWVGRDAELFDAWTMSG